jgi:Na+/H+ antiporter NhaC
MGLLLGVIIGCMALNGPFGGLRHAVLDVLGPTLTSRDNQLITIFTLAMLGMVHVSIASGGFADLARRISAGAHAGARAVARRTRMASVLLGLAIFFDDYANALVVGSSMRPLADRTGVSRAKLAFLVDATSAAVAGIAIVSTWVGFEVGLLGEHQIAFESVAGSPYGIFLAILPYRYYCLFTIAFALLIAWSGRDYGPMLTQERQAARSVASEPEQPAEEAGRAHFLDAIVPVLLVLSCVIGLDIYLGAEAGGGPIDRFTAGAEAAGLQVLAIAGVIGTISALAITISRRLLRPEAALKAWYEGVRNMLPVIVVLMSAMAMRTVTEHAGTQDYLAAMLGQMPGQWMPLVSFLTAGVVAFLTGSSWATMGIMIPIVIPLAALVPGADASHFGWLLASGAAVLDGAIFGDHCSPLSDTTVMSSAASDCPHDLHVITQLPYALTVMLIAALTGYVGTAMLAWPPWAAYGPGLALILMVVYGVGQPIVPPPRDERPASRLSQG